MSKLGKNGYAAGVSSTKISQVKNGEINIPPLISGYVAYKMCPSHKCIDSWIEKWIGKRETINMNRRKIVEYHIDMILKLVLHFININVYMYSIFYLKQVYLA